MFKGAQHTAADTTGQVDDGETVSSETTDVSEIDSCTTADDGESVSSEVDGGNETPEGSEERQNRLFQELATLRKMIASEAGLPPCVIFHDSTLKEMGRVLPQDLESLYSVQGVGKANLEKYGALFISAIREHTEAA